MDNLFEHDSFDSLIKLQPIAPSNRKAIQWSIGSIISFKEQPKNQPTIAIPAWKKTKR